jgi:putative ABC transport system permease protein
VYKISEIQQGQTIKYTFLMGYDPEKSILEEFLGVGIAKGRSLSGNEQGNVVLGYNFMFDNKILPRGLDLNDRIIINERNLRVIGFYESIGNPQDDAVIYVNLDYIDRIYPGSGNNFGMVVARVDVENMDLIIENIEKNLRKSRDVEKGKEDFYVASFQDLLENYSSALNAIIGFVILIALISVFVSIINTANTMITSVLERTKEIGLMKSIGAKNSEIFNIFLFESSFLGFFAGVIGVLLGFILTSIGSFALTELGWSFLKPLYSFELFLGCILFATITGAISGVWPAINAAKTNPVDALRYE